MSDPVLVMPRRLAVEILHAAQIAQPAPIRGVVGARDGEPVSFHADRDVPPTGVQTWATLWSHPQSAAIPAADELAGAGLSLVVSLSTKGVLELRAWRRGDDGLPREQPIRIRD